LFMQESTPIQKTPENFVEGLYDFIRAHLVGINNVILASVSSVSVLDFLAPRLSVVPTFVYSITAGLAVLMLLAAFYPVLIGKILQVVDMTVERTDLMPLWKKPLWQFVLALLACITVVGFGTIAKADEGGHLASKYPELRQIQISLLSLQPDTAEIKRGVALANEKLDTLVAGSKDPQKDLVARGYKYDSRGLALAIQQGDRNAVGLFVKAGLKVTENYPIFRILVGDQPWDPKVADMLTPQMFQHPKACNVAAAWAHEPFEDRVLAFKRLCGAGEAIAKYESRLREIETMAKPLGEYLVNEHLRYKKALELLRQ
jgi:hypothetical protein